MAETIFQKRIHELDEFIALAFGEPGWEDPATIWLGVDRVNWSEAKKMSLLEFISNLHKEQGPYAVTGVNINVVFDADMAAANYYLHMQLTRVVNVPNVGNVTRTIPFKNFNKSISGFSLELEEYIAGDSLNFLAFE